MTPAAPRRVLVAMSGGVDSSVAAALLRDQGHDVTGVTLRLWGGESDSGCCAADDVEDARRVAAQLGIPHYVFNLADEFEARVVAPYVDAYERGETPNPCIACNQTMKWGRLFERALAMGFDALATGHHARIEHDPASGSVTLRRGADRGKDQSYVLAGLSAAQLDRTVLPVGRLRKADVRGEAAARGLRTAAKRESMDVCFIARHGRDAFLAARASSERGPLVGVDGTHLGTHAGVARFTIGQRRGLRVALGERRYVIDVDAPTRTVTVGTRADLLRDVVPVWRPSFAGAPPRAGELLDVQVRAHGEPAPGRWLGDRVAWATPQPRVAPGQLVALYRDDVVVGAATAA